MKNLPLKSRLTRYLKNNPGWIASGELQRLVAQKTTYTPRTTVRRLEELAEEGTLEVDYRKGHAYYRFKGEHRGTGQIETNNANITAYLSGPALSEVLDKMNRYYEALPTKSRLIWKEMGL